MKNMKHILLALLMFAAFRVEGSEWLVEGKAAYFLPTSDRFKDIYDGGGIYGAELTRSLPICDWPLYAFGSINYFTKKGESLGLDYSTRIRMLPIAIGLKYIWHLDSDCWCWLPSNGLDLYVGLGAVFTDVSIKDNSPYVKRKLSKWAYGGIVKFGAIYELCDCWFLDLAFDYTAQEAKFKHHERRVVYRHNATLDGWSFGVGLGYRFGCCD